MELELISVIIFLICIAIWKLTNSKFAKLVNKFPGPTGWPLIGNALDFMISHEKVAPLLISYQTNYPNGFRVWLGIVPYIFLIKASDVETVLSSSTLIDKSMSYDFLQPWLGTGLLTSTGRKWQTRRKLLTPTFHFRILDDFMPVFNEQCEILIQILNQNVKKSSYDIYPAITLCALDILCESVMGVKVNAQVNHDLPFVKALDKIKDVVHSRMIKVYLWPDLVFRLFPEGREHAECLKIIHGFSDKVIRERKATSKENSQNEGIVSEQKKRLAFLDLLIQTSDNGKNLSDSDIREEVDTFMFEGHDTTAVAISWTVYLLGLHQDVQKKVHEEMDSIFGDDTNRYASMQDVKQMKYLDLVIKESQRLFPSVPIIAREVKSDVTIDGKIIPPGSVLMISPFLMHRNPDVFPDPEIFNPDRFLPENSLNRNPFAYVPFSAGPRNCIGQKFALLNLKVFLSRIFRSFKIESLEPQDKVTFTVAVVTLPKDGIKVRITPRNIIN